MNIKRTGQISVCITLGRIIIILERRKVKFKRNPIKLTQNQWRKRGLIKLTLGGKKAVCGQQSACHFFVYSFTCFLVFLWAEQWERENERWRVILLYYHCFWPSKIVVFRGIWDMSKGILVTKPKLYSARRALSLIYFNLYSLPPESWEVTRQPQLG